MKRLLALTALPLVAIGQTLTLTGPATVKPNTPVTFTLTCSGCATAATVTALEWGANFPNSSLTWTIGAAGSAAAKSLNCSTTGNLCVLVGLNQTTIADGVIATATWTPKSSGTFSYNVAGVLASTGVGKAATVTAGTAVSLTISSPCDINGDGVVNQADILAFEGLYVFVSPQPANPINTGNTAADVQRIANAADGGACVTGP